MATKITPPKAQGDALNQLVMGQHIDAGIARIGFGATAGRPATLTTEDTGFMFFDTTLHKPVFWKGSGWVDATGTAA